jgi:hypothetical protein
VTGQYEPRWLYALGCVLVACELLGCSPRPVESPGGPFDARPIHPGSDADVEPLDSGPSQEGPDATLADDAATTIGDAEPQRDASSLDAEPLDARPDANVEDAEVEDAAPPPPPPPVRQVTLCMAGALTREDGGNPLVEALCNVLPNRLEDCGGARCYPMFAFASTNAAIDALVEALDDNGDGAVDAHDSPCEINLLGYSWGGVNVLSVAESFGSDPRVSTTRNRIDRVALLDAYSPLAGSDLAVPLNVARLWSYRHSVAPASDCSAAAPLGPYLGLPPRCDPSRSVCTDYDYSLAFAVGFTGLSGLSYRGDEVDHCYLPDAAGRAVFNNFTTGADDPQAPPSVPVAPL